MAALKKYLIFLLLASAAISCRPHRVGPHFKKRIYKSVSLVVSNPASAASKAAAGLETRYGNFSYMATYTHYHGAYPGKAIDMDFRVYMRNYWRWRGRKWYFQNFVYLRGFSGIVGFDGDKLSMFSYPKNVYAPDHVYTGGAVGWGRKYTHNGNRIFAAIRVGARVAPFIDMTPEDKPFFRTFYATGPGSVFELNLQLGVRLF